MKRRCRAQRVVGIQGFDLFVAECQRKHRHDGRHKVSWREGVGRRFVDVVVRWK